MADELWAGSPVISNRPWFETLDEARIYREKLRLKEESEVKIDKCIEDQDDQALEETEKKYRQMIKDAKPIARADDPDEE